MTKEEFIERYGKYSNISRDLLLKRCVIMECNCNSSTCMGWAVVSNNPLSIKAHKDLYSNQKPTNES